MAKCRALISKACDEICPPLPPNPELRDCNSNDECGDCEICDAAGECVPDPGCCNGDDNIYVKYKRTYKLFSSSIVSSSWGSTCDDNPPGYFDDGTPCVSKCRSSGEGSNQITREYCFKKSDKVEIGAAGNTFIGFPDLGCCETSPSTTYSLYVNGSAIGGEDITINGGSTAFGGGQQNNCYSGGYHSFYATGAKCGTCPD